MKKILFRKIILDCSIFFLITLISSSIIVWVFQAVNFLDIVIEDGRNYIVYLNYTILNLPKIISKLIPFTLFFSFWYVLNKYESNNELIIFSIHGVSKLEIINFFIKYSYLLVVLQIILTSLVIPNTQDLARSTLRTSEVNFFGNFMKSKNFNDIIKDLTIYIDEKDENGNLRNVYLKKKDNNQSQITYAKKGIIKFINTDPVLILFDGETINNIGSDISKFRFSQSSLNLSNLETNTTTYMKTQETPTEVLIKCIIFQHGFSSNKNFKGINCNEGNINNVYKEIYKRFFIPIYIPILVLISLLTIINSKDTVRYTKNKIMIFLMGLLTIIFSESTLGYISNIFLGNLFFVIMPIMLLLFLYLTIFIKLRIKLF